MAHSISLAGAFVKHLSRNSELTNKKFFLKATHDGRSQPVIPANVAEITWSLKLRSIDASITVECYPFRESLFIELMSDPVRTSRRIEFDLKRK